MKKNVFIDKVQMSTDTVFHVDGCIDIYPCRWEDNQQMVSGAREVVQQGRMLTQDDGTSHFTPYRHSLVRRYIPLFSTDHGEVKETPGGLLIITHRFPMELGERLIERMYHDESQEIDRRLERLKF